MLCILQLSLSDHRGNPRFLENAILHFFFYVIDDPLWAADPIEMRERENASKNSPIYGYMKRK